MCSGLYCTDEVQQLEKFTWLSAVCLDRKEKVENDKIERIGEKGKGGATFNA